MLAQFAFLLTTIALAFQCQGLQIIKVLEQSCKVETSEGIVDFSSVAGETQPAFNASSLTYSVLWNPCRNASVRVGGAGKLCAGELIVVENQTCDAIGWGSQSKFVIASSGQLALIYNHTISNTTVSLYCNKNLPGKGVLINSVTTTNDTTYKGKYACPISPSPTPAPRPEGGLSVGSILLIIFWLSLFVYLVGGILILKLIRKREGSDIVPNKEFWVELPGLVKEGAVFTFTCGKGTASGSSSEYDNI